MRISDWSSDVCSSDLEFEAVALRLAAIGIEAEAVDDGEQLNIGPVDVKGRGVDREAPVGGLRLDPRFIADQRIRAIGLRRAGRDARRQQIRTAGPEALGDPRIEGDRVQIGRASCRERVCKYE